MKKIKEKKSLTKEELEKKIQKKNKFVKVFYWSLFTLMIISLIYAVTMTIITPNTIEKPNQVKLRSDYLLMVLQCILTFVVLFIPSFIEKKFKLVIPTIMEVGILVFLYLSIFLGEIRNFYYKVPMWDAILHFTSGLGIGALGFSVVNIFNKSNKVHLELSPIFTAFFAFCFSLAIGMIWEIYEFGMDTIFSMNMQKYMPDGWHTMTEAQKLAFANGESFETLAFKYGVKDTMHDIMLDFLGSLIMSVIGFFLLKFKKGKLDNILIKIIDDEVLEDNLFKQISIDEYIKDSDLKKNKEKEIEIIEEKEKLKENTKE